VRAEKQEAILTAARKLFSTRGVADVTMDDIAKAAGVSKGALYLHFTSKDELYLHLSTQNGTALLERLTHASAQQSNGFAAFKAMAHAYANFCLEEPTRFRLDMAWLTPDHHVDYRFPSAQKYRDVRTGIIRLCVDTFLSGQRDGSIRGDVDASTTVYRLWGGILGIVVLHTKAIEPVPLPPQAHPSAWRQVADDTPSPIVLDRFVPDYIDWVMELVENGRP
jgi:AcrR family transcriptional regulator